MRVYKVVPLLVLFLLLTSGQSMQMIEQAYALCCPIWKKGCVTWQGLVYGSAEKLGTVSDGPRFRIRDDKGFTMDIKGSQAIADEFDKEFIEKRKKIDYGFSIVSSATGEPVLIAFVPVDPTNHNPPEDKTLKGAGGAVQVQNKLFEEFATPPIKGGGGGDS